jgi:hypothetical protein
VGVAVKILQYIPALRLLFKTLKVFLQKTAVLRISYCGFEACYLDFGGAISIV